MYENLIDLYDFNKIIEISLVYEMFIRAEGGNH